EDGIRDRNVTGVQTCALPIYDTVDHLSDVLQRAVIIEDKNFELVAYSSPDELSFDALQQKTILTKRCPLFVIERLKKEGIVSQRSEERRVGKECRAQWTTAQW